VSDLQVNPIEEVLEEFGKGNTVIMVDDQDRENEGDLFVAAEAVNDRHINFMASKARGLICLALTEERCNQLELPLMVSRNNARFSTNFTVSIEGARDVTTGISAQDRARTIQAAVAPGASPKDIVTPGHVFPIKAQPGGVLTRAGHTEAGVDMARLSGFEPATVICEILREDGTMARLPDLMDYAREHRLKIGTIADLIRYRLDHDPTLIRISEHYLTLEHGKFRGFVFRDEVEGGTHFALVKGELSSNKVVPVRVHVHRGALDVILNPQSTWSWTLENATASIAAEEVGVVVILSYNETADELVKRIRTNSGSTDRVVDPDQSSEPQDLRMLGAGSQILADLGVRRILALGRSKRTHGLSGFGLEIVDYVETPAQLQEWKHANQ